MEWFERKVARATPGDCAELAGVDMLPEGIDMTWDKSDDVVALQTAEVTYRQEAGLCGDGRGDAIRHFGEVTVRLKRRF